MTETEAEIKPVDRDGTRASNRRGSPFVRLDADTDGEGYLLLSAAEARALAAQLLQAAKQAEETRP